MHWPWKLAHHTFLKKNISSLMKNSEGLESFHATLCNFDCFLPVESIARILFLVLGFT